MSKARLFALVAVTIFCTWAIAYTAQRDTVTAIVILMGFFAIAGTIVEGA